MATGERTSADRLTEVTGQVRTAVERLLEDQPFTALSVEEIIREAGIARSTFYVYFDDKGAMLQACAEGLLTEARAVVAEWWELPDDAGFEDLRAALGRFLTLFYEHRLLMTAVVDAATYDARVRVGHDQMVATGVEGVTAHIRAGQTTGAVQPGIDADAVARWLVWLVDRGCHQVIANAGPRTLPRQIDAVSVIVWNTLYRGVRG